MDAIKVLVGVVGVAALASAAWAAAPAVAGLDQPQGLRDADLPVATAEGWCDQRNVAAAGTTSFTVPVAASATTGALVTVSGVSATGALQVMLNPSETTAPTGSVSDGSAWAGSGNLPYALYVPPRKSTTTSNTVYVKNNNSYGAIITACTKYAY
jgi:hypothetical protein